MPTKLDIATQNILDFCAMVPKTPNLLDKFDVTMITGGAHVSGIINTEEVAICKMTVEDGSQSDWHFYNEMERFVWCNGGSYVMEYKIDDVIYSKEVYQNVFYVDPGIPHRMKSSNGKSESTLILIPGSTNFPKGQ